jgi:transcriptional regulator with XRE-family HTH domain
MDYQEGHMAKAASGKASAPSKSSPLTDYLIKQIDIVTSMGKTQRDIAEALGYNRPNMISMMKYGDVKIPLAKVPALAKVLNVDPAHLMRLVLAHQYGEEGAALAAIFGSTVTKNEAKLLETWRSIVGDEDPEFTPAMQRAIRAAVKLNLK